MRVIFLAATILCLMEMAASAQPSKMNPSPDATGVEGPTGTSAEPSKMNKSPDATGVEGLTGAMRDVGFPWLDHAINDVGTNPTGWKRQWCAKSVNLWLQRSGKKGCGGNTAISCLSAGRKLDGPTIGALAVMKHHVGIVKEVHRDSDHARLRQPLRTVGSAQRRRRQICARARLSSPTSGLSSASRKVPPCLVMPGLDPGIHSVTSQRVRHQWNGLPGQARQ